MAAAQDVLPPDAASLLRRTLDGDPAGRRERSPVDRGCRGALGRLPRDGVDHHDAQRRVRGHQPAPVVADGSSSALALTVMFLGPGSRRAAVGRVRRAARPRGGGVGRAAAARPRRSGGLAPVAARCPVRPDRDRPGLPPGARRAPALVLAHARLRLRGRRLGGGLARSPRVRQPRRQLQRDVRLHRRRDPAAACGSTSPAWPY